MKRCCRSVGPVRFDPVGVTVSLSEALGDRGAALMAVPLLLEVARVARPGARYGALLLEVTGRASGDVAGELARRWPDLGDAVDGSACAVAAVELVNERADGLFAAAMTAARIGGDSDGGVAA